MAKPKVSDLLKNKKLMIILIIAVILVVAIIFIAIGVSRKSSIKNQVKTMFSDIKTANFNKIAKYIDHETINNNVTEEEEGIVNDNFKIFFSGITYKIESIKIEGDKAIVKLEVKNKDMETVLNNYATTAVSKKFNTIKSDETEEDVDKFLLEFLQSEYDKADTLTTKLEIVLNKEKGKWVINKENQNGKNIVSAILPRYLKFIGKE